MSYVSVLPIEDIGLTESIQPKYVDKIIIINGKDVRVKLK